jgi:hypothetical protein
MNKRLSPAVQNQDGGYEQYIGQSPMESGCHVVKIIPMWYPQRAFSTEV